MSALLVILIGMNYKLFITQYVTQDDLLNHPVYSQLLTDVELIKVQNYGNNFRNTIIKDYFDVALNTEINMAKEYVRNGAYLKMNNEELKKLADIFNAPFTLYSKNIVGSFRSSADKAGVKMLLFEGGKSLDINKSVASIAVDGVKRLLSHLEMLDDKHAVEIPKTNSIYIDKSGWLRAKCSGLFHDNNLIGTYVEKGTILGLITDPFGKFEQKVKAPNNGYVINANHSPIVYEGDAIYHMSNILGEGGE